MARYREALYELIKSPAPEIALTVICCNTAIHSPGPDDDDDPVLLCSFCCRPMKPRLTATRARVIYHVFRAQARADRRAPLSIWDKGDSFVVPLWYAIGI